MKVLLNKILSTQYFFIFLASFSPLALALISQYFFGLHPCELCIYQRIPFVVVIALSVVLFFFRNSNQISKFILAICAIGFLVNAGIGFYHIGVEQHWWQFGECSGNFDLSNFEKFKASIMNAPSVRCDEVQFRFLGLSMAAWNFIYCLALAAFIVYYYLTKKASKSESK